MFTGIIMDMGSVAQVAAVESDLSIFVIPNQLAVSEISVGDSIAINGVCLTVREIDQQGLWFDISSESLSKTTLDRLAINDLVNLEKALTPNTALGGHLVSGHVDGTGEIIKRRSDARSERFWINVPQTLCKYIAVKGSVCVDGVSLTVNNVEQATFDVNIVPHTLEHTIFSDYQIGHRVNIEVDIIARYLEKLMNCSDGKQA